MFDVATAKRYAREGRIDEWIHSYLNTPEWANVRLSKIIAHQKPLWIGPVEISLSQLTPVAGPGESARFRKDPVIWEREVRVIVDSLRDPEAVPPMIVRQVSTGFSIPDGNHRYDAMLRVGWTTAWALLWCDRDECFRDSFRID